MNDFNINNETVRLRSFEEALNVDSKFDSIQLVKDSFAKMGGLKIGGFSGFKVQILIIYLIFYVFEFVLKFVLEFFFPAVKPFLEYNIPENSFMFFLFIFLVLIIAGTMQSATINLMSLSWIRFKKSSYRQIRDILGVLPTLVLISFMMALVTTIGFFVFILPGIYLSVAYIFSIFIILDNPKINVWKAMEASRKVVSKNFFNFFFLLFILAIFNLVAYIPYVLGLFLDIPTSYFDISPLLLFGLFWTVPTSYIAIATLYRKIFEEIPTLTAPQTTLDFNTVNVENER